VAIKYDAQTMDVPMVVAKGSDFLAHQIRKIAAEHRIPIVERKALARALFETVEIGQFVDINRIAPEHVQTLIDVLAYVYRLTGRAAPKR
jgi:flagellar biosynthetic protein FlhB